MPNQEQLFDKVSYTYSDWRARAATRQSDERSRFVPAGYSRPRKWVRVVDCEDNVVKPTDRLFFGVFERVVEADKFVAGLENLGAGVLVWNKLDSSEFDYADTFRLFEKSQGSADWYKVLLYLISWQNETHGQLDVRDFPTYIDVSWIQD